MKAPAFAYLKPQSLAEVFDALERYGEDAQILAGGQTLVATLNMRLSSPSILIDITGLANLRGIALMGNTVRIGALTTHRQIERSVEVAQHLPLLAQAVPNIAHVAIRNAGTIGGSIAFADPAAEWPACCLALDAEFVLAGRAGERRVKARDFFKGLYDTARGPKELLIAIEIPGFVPGMKSAFLELARRHGDYAIVGVAAVAKVSGTVLSDVRLAFLGAGATPLLASHAMRALEGRPAGALEIKAAQDALAQDLSPSADLYSQPATKMHLARVLTGRAISALIK